ncbi:hypothetical protein N7454_005040 [Penicillium verhagenii]|nr:hypothetical protein N7454_005040 [Penicillium verhagenii]
MSQFMDQQLPLQVSDDLPLSNRADIHQKPALSTQSRPLLQESVNSNITSLLSARSYPLPESYMPQAGQSNRQIPITANRPQGSRTTSTRTNTNQTTIPEPQKRRRRQPKKSAPSAKNFAAVRDGFSDQGNSEERRRTQIRLAQRAYRSRQQNTIEDLKRRITHLELVLDNMSTAVLSFSEQLVRSGVLGPHSGLTLKLRDMMRTFHSLASEASPEDGMQHSGKPTKTTESSQSSLQSPINPPSPKLSSNLLNNPDGSYQPEGDIQRHSVSFSGKSIVGVSEFIEKLHLAAIYQGYVALCDQSIGLDRLQRPFGLMFSMMNRECLASYFKAEYNAQLSQNTLVGWDEVPFFRLGGAGTHYSVPSTQGQSASTQFVPDKRWGIVEDALFLVPSDVQKQLEGDWFDLQDLEGFLRQMDVLLLLNDEQRGRSSPQININISLFIPVTEGSRGIGAATALELAKRGAKIAITFVNGASAIKIKADMRSLESPKRLVDETTAAFEDSIDILVENAGVESGKPLENISVDEYTDILDSNVCSVIFMTQAVLPHLRSPGHIIDIGSVMGRVGRPGASLYSATKVVLEALPHGYALVLG